MHDTRLLLLSPDDNVLSTVRTIEAGEIIVIRDQEVRMQNRISIGHKIAAQPIEAGEKIIKYGVPIGSARRPIAAGEHVHLHNMKSDYLPTYTLEEERRFVKSP